MYPINRACRFLDAPLETVGRFVFTCSSRRSGKPPPSVNRHLIYHKDASMKIWRKSPFILLAALSGFVAITVAQEEGPKKDVGETVAKPRKKDGSDTDLPKIPSKLTNKNKDLP